MFNNLDFVVFGTVQLDPVESFVDGGGPAVEFGHIVFACMTPFTIRKQRFRSVFLTSLNDSFFASLGALMVKVPDSALKRISNE